MGYTLTANSEMTSSGPATVHCTRASASCVYQIISAPHPLSQKYPYFAHCHGGRQWGEYSLRLRHGELDVPKLLGQYQDGCFPPAPHLS